jgi:hypothetical protein
MAPLLIFSNRTVADWSLTDSRTQPFLASFNKFVDPSSGAKLVSVGDVDSRKEYQLQSREESAMEKPKVFYNSACPVCRAGVESQRGSMLRTRAAISWHFCWP